MIEPLPWRFDDGGRSGEFRATDVGDCAARAIAIATDEPYRHVYDALNSYAEDERPRSGARRSNARTGVWRRTAGKLLVAWGFRWEPTMAIGSGCRVHVRRGELPEIGRLVLYLSRHYSAVVHGVVRDTYDPSRDGSRCVYGFWGDDRAIARWREMHG